MKIEVADEQGQPIQVELGREQHERLLSAHRRERVLKPRKVLVFMQER